jgi:hypothetical protein
LLKPGHATLVTLSATRIEATERLRDLAPVKRNCYFSMYKKYTQSNCFLGPIL